MVRTTPLVHAVSVVATNVSEVTKNQWWEGSSSRSVCGLIYSCEEKTSGVRSTNPSPFELIEGACDWLHKLIGLSINK